MKKIALHLSGLIIVACFMVPVLASGAELGEMPKNIILLIGDGMGAEHVELAGYDQLGPDYDGDLFSFEGFPYKNIISSARHYTGSCKDVDPEDYVCLPDSASTATAIATGHRVDLAVLSVRIPGSGKDMKTILEIFKDNDKSTGLVTSASYLDATPAAFGGHAADRNNFGSIIGTMFVTVRPNLILGGFNASWLHGLGYTVLSNTTEMDDYLAIEKDNDPNDKHVLGAMAIPDIGMWGQAYKRDSWGPWFYATYPDLSEMSEFALDILEEDADGFFLMIEAGLIDLAAHENNADLEIGETLEFDQTVQLVVDWYNALGEEDKADTLIIVTADHETGGLDVDCSEEECPSFWYNVDSHSTRWVPVYAIGYNADAVEKITHQFQLFKIMTAEMVVD